MHAKVHQGGSRFSPSVLLRQALIFHPTLYPGQLRLQTWATTSSFSSGFLGSNLDHHNEFCLQSHPSMMEFLLSILRLCLLQQWFLIETLPIGIFAGVWRCLWLSQMEVGCLLSRDQGCGWTSYSPQGNYHRKSDPASDVNSLQNTLNLIERAHWRIWPISGVALNFISGPFETLEKSLALALCLCTQIQGAECHARMTVSG